MFRRGFEPPLCYEGPIGFIDRLIRPIAPGALNLSEFNHIFHFHVEVLTLHLDASMLCCETTRLKSRTKSRDRLT